jgi:DNA-binding MarR family transcriptional regulator
VAPAGKAQIREPAVDSRPPPPDRDPLALGLLVEFIGFRTGRVNFHLARRFAAFQADLQLKPGSFTALAMISANEGLSQTALARQTGFDGASVVSLMDDFERRGWAVRSRSAKDRRRHSLYVTPAGETALRGLYAMARQVDQPVTDALSRAELDQLCQLLDRAYAALVPEG